MKLVTKRCRVPEVQAWVIEQRDDFDVYDAVAVVLGSQADALAECERRRVAAGEPEDSELFSCERVELVDARSR